MTDADRQARQSVIDGCLQMQADGLNQGTSGNISLRHNGRMLITPSGVPYDAMTPEMIASMSLTDADDTWEGPKKPSTEWQFHRDILMHRTEVGAVVHLHSTYATALAMAHKPIPACHYMVAAFGGNDVRCGGYARYGTAELSRIAIDALTDRTACLLANHGMIALGNSLDKALWTAVELETLAKQYYLSLTLGGPKMLSDAQMAEVHDAFATYGLQEQ